MLYIYDINAPAPDGQLYINKPRRFPNYPGIAYEDNGASHNYNGVSVEVKRRTKSGLAIPVLVDLGAGYWRRLRRQLHRPQSN